MPDPMVFYALCTFWTDDWSALGERDGVPCCPECGSVGFEMDSGEWRVAVARYEADGHPGYTATVAFGKEKCFKDHGAVERARREEAG